MRLLSSTLAIVLILGVAQPAFGQSATRTENPNQESPPPPPQPSRIYYGGTLGFNLFGDVFRMSVQPLVGYKLSEKFSVGAKVGYEYIKDKRFDPSRTYHNYGASVFARYRFIPRAYFHSSASTTPLGESGSHFSWLAEVSANRWDRTPGSSLRCCLTFSRAQSPHITTGNHGSA
jgi:hypothetical protein